MNFDSFVGSAYNAASPGQDNQLCINWYVEVDKSQGAKTVTALLSVPGLSDLGQSTYTGAVRGLWCLQNLNTAIVVIGAHVLLMTPNIGTLGTRPVFSYTLIGSLNTVSGPVGIRDNGQGGICVIVDGQHLYVYNITTGVFNTSTDPAFLGSNVVTEIDGIFIFAKPGTQTFYTTPVYWNGVTAIDATYFALKDDSHDVLVSMIEQNRLLWLLGSETTEVWYNQGGTYFQFGRLQGTLQQIGCAAFASVARYGDGLIWLARSERGNNQIVSFQGYQPTVISNPALSYQINQYSYVGDAQGYVYNEEGHEFYVLIFPTANATWVYDLTVGEWHQRASFDPVNGVLNRQRVNCVMNFQNMIIAGDYQTGQIYWQTRTVFTDGNYPLVAIRRAPHLWDKENRARMRHDQLQIELKTGSASLTGTYTNPQAILKWSDDGGQTFSNEHFATIGLTGQTKNRVIWRRLGIARDRVYEVKISDPVTRDIVGASIMGVAYKT